MSDKYILKDGEPVLVDDVLAWGRWFEKADEERRVEWTEVTDGITVSTVFLGVDHNFFGETPILYETMVFGGDLDEEVDRYSTREQALEGHRQMVERVKAVQP